MSEYIKRLIACGLTERNAEAIVKGFLSRNDYDGLEDFTETAESLFRERW